MGSSVLGAVATLARTSTGPSDGTCEPCCIHSNCGEAGWYDDGACGAAWYCTDDQWNFDMGSLDDCCIYPALGSPAGQDEGCHWQGMLASTWFSRSGSVLSHAPSRLGAGRTTTRLGSCMRIGPTSGIALATPIRT